MERIKRKGRKGEAVDAKDAKKLLLLRALCVFTFAIFAFKAFPSARIQEAYPQPPADRTLIYFADAAKNSLTPLPFEAGETPLRVAEVARSDKRSYVEVKGMSASTLIETPEPRFYLFVPDEKNVHTPFLVQLTNKGGGRRVTAMAQRGLKGFAVDSEQIIMPHYRVLMRDGGMLYIEFRPRQPLLAGEYAFVGADLERIATFRIGAKSVP